MKLVFVRHGQTPSNVADVLESAIPGPALTSAGWAQAAAVAETLVTARVDAIYASTQLRALQTASRLASLTGRPIHVRDGLREVACGDYELRGDQAAIDGYWDAISAWANGDLARVMPGAETGADMISRFDTVIDEIVEAGHRTVVVVSHGGSIRGWTAARATNVSTPTFVTDYLLDNTGVVEVDGDPAGGWRIVSWMGEPLA